MWRLRNKIILKTIPIIIAGKAICNESRPEVLIAIISFSFSNFEKVINIPKKTPKEILIVNHDGMLKIDSLKKSIIVPPLSRINLIDLKDWLTQTSPIITRVDIIVFIKDNLKMYLKIRII